jgi:AAA+ ATPase superfamily predicted ATPase
MEQIQSPPFRRSIPTSVRQLGRILLRPSRWAADVARLDITLPPDCTLDQVFSQPRRALLRGLLPGFYLYLPLMMVAGIVPLWLGGASQRELFLAAAAPILISLVLFATAGVTFGVAVGLALSVLGGFGIAFANGLVGNMAYPFQFTQTTALVYGALIGLAGSLAGSLAARVQNTRASVAIVPGEQSTWISGTLTGMLISGSAVFASHSILLLLVYALFDQPPPARPLLAIWPALGLLAALTLIFMITVGVRRALVILSTIAIACVLATLLLALFGALRWLEASGLAYMLVFLSLLGVPYVMTRHLVGPRASVLAGALTMGVACLMWIMLESQLVFWEIALPAGIATLAGLSLPWWGPLVIHPPLEMWALCLLRLDTRRSEERPYLRWHPAFWLEVHWLPYHNLVEHLLLIAERNPALGQASIEQLITAGHQQRAAQTAQIELYARRLNGCDSLEAIADLDQGADFGDQDSPVSTIARGFRRVAQTSRAALSGTTLYHRRLALAGVREEADTLLRDLSLSNNRYAPRFRPIAAQWQRIVTEREQQLIQLIQAHQEIDNPYIFSIPLTEQQGLFVGRVDIAARIEQLLLDRRRPPLLLYGQRRMGKTSLLRNLRQLLPSSTVLFFVDGEGISVSNDYADFLYAVASSMARSAEQHRQLSVPPPDRTLLAQSPFSTFNEWLDEIEHALDANGDKIALLALDEFEALDEVFGKGRFDGADIMRLLRNLIQHRPRFKVLLAGSHTLEELRHWASYLINLQVVKISYLNEQDTFDLIERPVSDFPLRYDPIASRRILDLTRGHPHLVQLLCYEIVELKNQQPLEKRLLVDVADVETAIPLALATGDFFFADLFNQVEGLGTEILYFLIDQPDSRVDTDTIVQRFGLDALAALELLMRRDVIEESAAGYRFQVELIRLWFIRHRPLAKYSRSA